jgi:cell wall-associated NlpC family hydrolase
MDTSGRKIEDQVLDLEFWKKAVDWIDTPFVHQQATRWGCDCVGLVVGIAKEMGYDLGVFDIKERPVNAVANILQEQVELATVKVDDYLPGSLLLFRVGRFVQHLAIFNEGRIIHTDRTMQSVKMIDYLEELKSRLVGIYVIDWHRIPRL